MSSLAWVLLCIWTRKRSSKRLFCFFMHYGQNVSHMKPFPEQCRNQLLALLLITPRKMAVLFFKQFSDQHLLIRRLQFLIDFPDQFPGYTLPELKLLLQLPPAFLVSSALDIIFHIPFVIQIPKAFHILHCLFYNPGIKLCL